MANKVNDWGTIQYRIDRERMEEEIKEIYFYRYESFDKNILTNDILITLDRLGEEGWEVVSHSHSQWGMSVLLKKQRIKSKDD